MKSKGGSFYARKRKKAEMRRAALAALSFYSTMFCLIWVAITSPTKPQSVTEAVQMVIPEVQAAHSDPCGLDVVYCDGEVMPEPVIVHETVEQIIERKAAEYGVDVEYAKKIAVCESGMRADARNWEGSSAGGVFQIIRGTMADGIRWRNLDWTVEDRFDAEKNIDMAMWLVKREGNWNRWACKNIVK